MTVDSFRLVVDSTVNVLKFLFLFSNTVLVIRAGIHKMFVRIANWEDPDQTASKKQSNLHLGCLSSSFGQATSVRNFRTFTVRTVLFGKFGYIHCTSAKDQVGCQISGSLKHFMTISMKLYAI